MRRAIVVAAAVVSLVVVGIASGASTDGPNGPWADAVLRFVQGPRIDGSPVMASRSNPTSALGPAEASPGNDNPIPEGTFASLGFGGELTLAFQNPICNGAGDGLAIDIREITKEPYPPETADVYVSADGISFTKVGTISKDAKIAVPKTIPVIWFVAFVDTTPFAKYTFGSNADGIDIDGVDALDTSSCTGTAPPMPPAGSGDPLAAAPAPPTTVKCTTAYWNDPRVLKTWPIGRTQQFNKVFGVKTYPRKTLLAVIAQQGRRQGRARPRGRVRAAHGDDAGKPLRLQAGDREAACQDGAPQQEGEGLGADDHAAEQGPRARASARAARRRSALPRRRCLHDRELRLHAECAMAGQRAVEDVAARLEVQR